MSFEVEQKFRVEGTATIEQRLGALGATPGEALRQVDIYYAHPLRDFAATDEALRIRTVGQKNYVTYKGPKIDATTKTRREIEIPLPDCAAGAEQFNQLLDALGFISVAAVRKHRRTAHLTWQDHAIEIALDDVEQAGQFVELEIQAEQAGVEEAKSCLASLAEQLGLKHNERRSYLELILAER